MVQTILGLFTGGGAAAGATAAGTAAAGVGAAGAAAGGISFSTILQGGLGLLSAVQSINAGNAQADAYNAQADDARAEQPLETLQGINRRSSIKRDMADAIGAQDVANAASSVDLSFGTPGRARSEAFREGDTALTADAGTETSRVARLADREAQYRKMAKKAKQAGVFDAILTGGKTALSIYDRLPSAPKTA